MCHRLPSIASAALLLLALLFAEAAQAHPGHDATAGLWAGLLHPFSGLDHLLAMLAIGLWSAWSHPPSAPRSRLLLPLLFVLGAAAGTGLGWAGVVDGRIEIAVAGSLLPLGLALVFGLHAGHRVALCLVALCGLLHGAAHGREMTQALSVAAVSGFLLGTALLHGIGAGLSRAWPATRRRVARAGTGSGLAAASLWLLA